VLQPDSVLTKEKPRRKSDIGILNPRLGKSINDTASLGYRRGITSLVGALAISFGGRRPFTMRHCSFASVTDEGTHSPILPHRRKKE
jgi:hypothetical protein